MNEFTRADRPKDLAQADTNHPSSATTDFLDGKAASAAGAIAPSDQQGGVLTGLPEVSEETLDALIVDIDRAGFGMIPNYIPADHLDRMRRFVAGAIAAAGHQYVGFVGRDAVAGSAFSDLSDTPAFRELMHRVYERGTRRPAPDAGLYQVLRCLAGETGKAHSLIFHYDSYVVTALIPVEIPRQGQTGDLVMLPFRRGLRRTYVANLIDKVLLDNNATQRLLRLLCKVGMLPLKRIKMIPGNIYFFWGYRTIHANEACDPTNVRATALYHFANPHAQSSFHTTLRRLIPR
jgi:hypothetical protein